MFWPAAEVSIDEPLVRSLLTSQYPQFTGWPCYQVGEGFDNALWRLGDELVVRIPRRQIAAELIANELRWLPEVAEHVTLLTPLPLLRGEPNERFAWPWLIARWIDGVPGDELLQQPRAATLPLATFLHEVHVEAPPEAPRNPFRGGPLRDHASTFDTRIRELSDVIDVTATRELWTKCLDAPLWEAPGRWLHGDLHPANTLYRDLELVGIVDFGDLCAGDPACDLGGVLMSLSLDELGSFFDAYRVADSAMMWRTIGWATHFGVLMASLGLADRPTYLAVGLRSLDNARELANSL
jgi:aminoglycoside phosphotransferase (APT) family kinase protein